MMAIWSKCWLLFTGRYAPTSFHAMQPPLTPGQKPSGTVCGNGLGQSVCDTERQEQNWWKTVGTPYLLLLLLLWLLIIRVCVYTGCPRRNVPDFGRIFLMLKYTDITQNTYIQIWTVTEIMAREVWKYDRCFTLIDYQYWLPNMWFL
jgi:hypothetical protein